MDVQQKLKDLEKELRRLKKSYQVLHNQVILRDETYNDPYLFQQILENKQMYSFEPIITPIEDFRNIVPEISLNLSNKDINTKQLENLDGESDIFKDIFEDVDENDIKQINIVDDDDFKKYFDPKLIKPHEAVNLQFLPVF
eukprot:TRINITY_DN778_c0_g1_i1.p1 TRINITY_DN778_c0_g1~~TRINITY_DN778_c0_g1_i1.p1  ORF type:complete len:154 (+),score=49.80 TRINITY_DN778_c0_g1_i1:40-462(+)